MPVYYFPVSGTIGGGGGGGWLIINDVVPQGAGVVSNKTFQDPAHTVLTSCTASDTAVSVVVKASNPYVVIAGVTATLSRSPTFGFYSGTVNINTSGKIKAAVLMSDGNVWTTESFSIAVDSPPTITSLSFQGTYPGAQTELKSGDVMTIVGTTDKLATGIVVANSGAASGQTINFASSTSFTASITIANRGNTAQLLAAYVQAKNAAGGLGSIQSTDSGGSVELVDVVKLNNLRPSLNFGTITYPAGQNALKSSENAIVDTTSSNYDTILFSSPNGQISIDNPTAAGQKTVQRQTGGYNISTPNIQASLNRIANNSTTTVSTVVRIADTAPSLTVSTPATRLRGGGSDGTSVQNYTITLASSEVLASAPTLDAPSGTFLGSWTGSGTTWTRTLQISDSDPAGTFPWINILATNEAGVSVSNVDVGATYTIGGFVARTVIFGPFMQTATLNVTVSDYSKLQAGIFTATNQQSSKMTVQGDTSNAADKFTVLAIGSNPTTLFWNDQAAASSNSGGTAQLINIEEIP